MKTDSMLQKDVYEELQWEASVCANEIGVSVRNKVVTLSGFVSSLAEKGAAENAAKRVSEVAAVIDNMTVRVPAGLAPSDQDLAEAAAHVLRWHVWIPHEHIHVTVKDGWITLTGYVEWKYQKEAVEHAVQFLAGVHGVDNKIVIKPQAEEQNIKAKIESALARSARHTASHIGVTNLEGDVCLTGQVHSWEERADAELAAWSAKGVTNVRNQIRIQ